METNHALLITQVTVADLKSLIRNELDIFFRNNGFFQKNAPDEDTFLNIKEVSVLLKLSIPTIYRFCSEKSIPYIKKRGKLLFSKEEIIMWAMESRRKTTKEIHSDVETWLGELGKI